MNRRNIITSALALAASLFVKPSEASDSNCPPDSDYWSRSRDEYAVFVEDVRKKYAGKPKQEIYSQRLTLVHRSDRKRLNAKSNGRGWRKITLETYLDGPVFQDFKEHKSPGQELVITFTDLKWTL